MISPPLLTDAKRPKLLEDYPAFLNQQVTFADFKTHYLRAPDLDDDEIDEHQNLMMSTASDVSTNLHKMEQRVSPWEAASAHWVPPGPFQENRYLDMVTGEAIFAQSDD
eukprot:4154524-Pyramimonas_sp.AAC.1